MTQSGRGWLRWSPRILGILAALYLGIFALDAVGAGPQALLLHLAPSLLLLVVVALSWRRAWLGGVVFIALAVLYASMARHRWDSILFISGPLLVVGLLSLWSWRHRESPPDRS